MAKTSREITAISSMSEQYFESLKNSEGKVPALNNQLIMTEEEDANVDASQLRTEVVYDSLSSDANKNWGYTSGILGGVTVSGKDFSKYSKLIIYSYNLDLGLTLIYNFDSNETNAQSASGLSIDNKALMQIKCSVDSSKTSFSVVDIGYYNTAGYTDRNNNVSYQVYRIEGVY